MEDQIYSMYRIPRKKSENKFRNAKYGYFWSGDVFGG